MNRPSRYSVSVAALGGVVHVVALLALFEFLEYVTIDATLPIGIFALLAFTQGAIAVLASAHTRLLTPAGGLIVVFSGVIARELSTAGDPRLFGMYVVSIGTGITIALLSFAGVVEFALRRGYGLGAGRLRNLPPLPQSRSRRRIVVGSAGFVGATAGVLGFLFGGPGTALIVWFLAAGAAAVPLSALLRDGLVAPLVPFALIAPYVLYGHAFYMLEVSGMGLVLLGPAAVLSVLVWKVEAVVRSPPSGWDSTDLADRSNSR